MMKSSLAYLKPFTGLIIIGLMAWYFSDVLLYIIIAAVLSILGRPMTRFLMLRKIGRFPINSTLAAIVTLLIIILIVTGFLMTIVPLINNQALMIAEINTMEVSEYFAVFLTNVHDLLVAYNIIPKEQSLQFYLEQQLIDLVQMINVTGFFGSLISTTGSILMGIFVVLFLSFFFLQDDQMLKNSILTILPDKYADDTKRVLSESRFLLTRYLLGIVLELVSMITLITIGLSIFGIRNAMIIGFLGGLMNIIPYLGPIIGATIGLILGIISVLSYGEYDQIVSTLVIILLTFSASNLIDNFFLQPMIYSKSVKAHPIEVFLVIILAGKLAGIGGMILAIPVYTVVRLIVRQFITHTHTLPYDVVFPETNENPDKPIE
ncbi:MAG: AI-2E family transporter [Bacteroidales bacterium]|nr:AI-2E family transporter [Bacteroidales bacterium]